MRTVTSTLILGLSLAVISTTQGQPTIDAPAKSSASDPRKCVKVRQRVFSITAEQLGIPIGTVRLQSNFVFDFGADSLDVRDLTMAIEDEFGIDISDDEAEKLTAVQHYVDYVIRRLACK